jgi:hypothetical protein
VKNHLNVIFAENNLHLAQTSNSMFKYTKIPMEEIILNAFLMGKSILNIIKFISDATRAIFTRAV